MFTQTLLSVGGFVLRIAALVVLGPLAALVSLLPLSALLLMLPAFVPDETVVTESATRPSELTAILRRLFALLAGLAALVALIVFAVELTAWLPLRPAMRWPVGILAVYLLDILLLLGIGKVPLAYNARNLMVRWRTTLLTGLAFTVVVGLLTVMLAFVRGMDAMTESSGKPGNVIVLSDGSTDEMFSNLGYNDLSTAERERATAEFRFTDKGDLIDTRPLANPVTVKHTEVGGRDKYLFSYETYVVVNQPMPPVDGRPSKRKFVQVRGVVDPVVSGLVHEIELYPGGQWFSEAGVDDHGRIQAVLGEGVADVFGQYKDRPPVVTVWWERLFYASAAPLGFKPRRPPLDVGDEFELGSRTYVVTGVMKSEGSTFGSEVWAKQSLIGEEFRKPAYTSCVLKAADHPDLSPARAGEVMSRWLRNNFRPKVQAITESEYYSKLSTTNKTFLNAIMIVAAIMAVGGIFGIMNTMFAAISQRTKDIGVMRILGFKRWQILVSFMLESLGIALLGGMVGVALGSLADGFTATSILSGGQGGGKFVVLRMIVGADLMLVGVVFTLVMGRLGGLVPALSAMRLGVLDSLR
jgi:putative ABC transport system permease protein